MCHRENRHLFLSSELEARLLAQSLPRHALSIVSRQFTIIKPYEPALRVQWKKIKVVKTEHVQSRRETRRERSVHTHTVSHAVAQHCAPCCYLQSPAKLELEHNLSRFTRFKAATAG